MKRIFLITLKSFVAGLYLYLIAQQVNTSNFSGTVLGLSIVVVLFCNMYLREELHAAKRHLNDTRHYARKYWEDIDKYQ
jgi:hypothetical protein